MTPMEFNLFKSDPKLSVIKTLIVHLGETKPVGKDKTLFISYGGPNRSVFNDTVARWCKEHVQSWFSVQNRPYFGIVVQTGVNLAVLQIN